MVYNVNCCIVYCILFARQENINKKKKIIEKIIQKIYRGKCQRYSVILHVTANRSISFDNGFMPRPCTRSESTASNECSGCPSKTSTLVRTVILTAIRSGEGDRRHFHLRTRLKLPNLT